MVTCNPFLFLFLMLSFMVLENGKCDQISAVSSNALFGDVSSTMVQTLYHV